MVAASFLDWRTRKVSNSYWIVLSVIAVALLPVQIVADDEKLEYLIVLVPIAAILSDVYFDAKGDSKMVRFLPHLKYGVAIASVAVFGYMWIDTEYFQRLLAIPVMMLVMVVLYMADVIRGGADAKALLSLSILFPFYPTFRDFPILRADSLSAEVIMPFSFIVLINAAIIVVLLPLGFLLKNIARRELKFPHALLGYKVDCETIEGKHLWLMERIENGSHKVYARPKSDENLAAEVEALVKAGHKRVWVTPKIPFMIPLLISLFISTVIGNLLLLLIPL
ncbi:MAG: A24 family peptidase C-terminal domain-containing protein [Thermoplasmata archaeon]